MSILTCPIADQARLLPNQTAIQLGTRAISFGDLHRQVLICQRWLRNRSVQAGSHVAIASKAAEWVIPMLYACFREQIVCVCLNPSFPLLEELMAETNSVLLLQDKELMDIISSDSFSEVSLSTQFSTQQWATIIRTSGSSGLPKWAVHSIGNHSFSALGANQNMPLTPDSRWLLTLPLYHVGGLGIVFRCLIAGACIVIDPKKRTLLHTLADLKPTHVSVVPTQLFWLVNELEKSPTTIQTCFLVGGAPLTEKLAERALTYHLRLYPTYGLTEMSSQVTTVSAPITSDFKSNVGKPLAFREIKLDSTGEILVKGSPLFQGYWNQKKVSLITDSEGFFSTGDLGFLTESGDLKIVGRKDSLIISGGENIQPEEIESALLEIEGVEQALVVARPHDEFGQRPVAFLKTSMPLSKDTLVLALEKELPRFKVPDDFFPWPHLDVNSGFKICRSDFLKYLR